MKISSITFLKLAIASFIILCILTVVQIREAISFDKNCIQYLKRASNANSVEMAKEELGKAISYAERHKLTEGIVHIFIQQPKNDIGYWYSNMVTAYEELDNLSENSTPLEKTNVLMKLRETLTDNNDDVTVPEGISIYPNNACFFWCSLILLIASLLFSILYIKFETDEEY